MAASAGERWGNYVLLERIGAGGMAEIFRAHRTGAASFAREVCLKRLHAHLCRDPEFTALFLDEARTGAKLRHKNIVGIDDLGEHDGQYFLAMEYVHGVDLAKIEQRARRDGLVFPHEAAAYIAAEVLAGLHAAHTATDPTTRQPLRVVHRDVSPHNVLVSFGGEVKLTDLGIARAEGRARVTDNQVVRGKFGYMPIEQSSGGLIDGRADLYALGVTLFELLAGQRPFCGDDPEATLQSILAAQVVDERPRLADVRPDVPAALREVVERCLGVRPDDRLPDAATALTVLQDGCDLYVGSLSLVAVMARLYPGQASAAFVPRPTVPVAQSPAGVPAIGRGATPGSARAVAAVSPTVGEAHTSAQRPALKAPAVDPLGATVNVDVKAVQTPAPAVIAPLAPLPPPDPSGLSAPVTPPIPRVRPEAALTVPLRAVTPAHAAAAPPTDPHGSAPPTAVNRPQPAAAMAAPPAQHATNAAPPAQHATSAPSPAAAQQATAQHTPATPAPATPAPATPAPATPAPALATNASGSDPREPLIVARTSGPSPDAQAALRAQGYAIGDGALNRTGPSPARPWSPGARIAVGLVVLALGGGAAAFVALRVANRQPHSASVARGTDTTARGAHDERTVLPANSAPDAAVHDASSPAAPDVVVVAANAHAGGTASNPVQPENPGGTLGSQGTPQLPQPLRSVSPPPPPPPQPPPPPSPPQPVDTDRDGIVDSRDMCPREPETRNGYLDTDGCPDLPPTPPVVQPPPSITQHARPPTGTVRVVFESWGELYIDGAYRGRAHPGQEFVLPAGPHTLRMTGGAEGTRSVIVPAGGRVVASFF